MVKCEEVLKRLDKVDESIDGRSLCFPVIVGRLCVELASPIKPTALSSIRSRAFMISSWLSTDILLVGDVAKSSSSETIFRLQENNRFLDFVVVPLFFLYDISGELPNPLSLESSLSSKKLSFVDGRF